ncbi:MAG TPA: hypothetical protein DCL74_03575 [Succinivibrionaceae bacterium]|nr:hypothetical protein [Succinivibrionaceae bacterium]
MMKLIIFASDPVFRATYEQGIEVALNLAEAELPVKAVMIGDFYRSYQNAAPNAVFRKKIKQLELFSLELLPPQNLTALLKKSDGVMSF